MRVKERTDFGERLRHAREHAKLSQPKLAKLVGLSQSTINGLEMRGQGSSKVASIARACGVRVLWLEKGEGPMVGPDDTEKAALHVAEDAVAPYLQQAPTSARDYRTIAHTMAAALTELGIEVSLQQFLALTDAAFGRFGKS